MFAFLVNEVKIVRQMRECGRDLVCGQKATGLNSSAERLCRRETNSSVVSILCVSLPLVLPLSTEKDRSEEATQGPCLINYLII